MGSKTPEEAFTGKKPDVSRFRIFGCMTYSHVPEEKRTKLEPTAKKGIFVGYSETSKAYRIYIPALRKIVLRRDVRFEEEKVVVKSRGLDQVQSGSQVQGDLIQGIGGGSGSQVSGVAGSQVTGSQVTGPQMTGTWSSGTGVSSEPVTGSGSATGSGTGSQSSGSTSSSSQPGQREDQLDSST